MKNLKRGCSVCLVLVFQGPLYAETAPTLAPDTDKGSEDSTEAEPLPENDPRYRLPVTPYANRIAAEAGDQAGGPVRFNTRFPSEAVDPNPASYYHAQAFFGLTFETSLEQGGLQFGVLTRRDFAHRGISGRTFEEDGKEWIVDKLEFHSQAASLGWVFGKLYKELPWRASLATVVDHAALTASLSSPSDGTSQTINMTLTAISLRGRGVFKLLGRGAMEWNIGPEFHVPVFSLLTKPTDEAEEKLADRLELKNSAALGLVTELGFRF